MQPRVIRISCNRKRRFCMLKFGLSDPYTYHMKVDPTCLTLKIFVDLFIRGQVDWLIRSKPGDRREVLIAVARFITKVRILTDHRDDEVSQAQDERVLLVVRDHELVERAVHVEIVVIESVVAVVELLDLDQSRGVVVAETIEASLSLVDHLRPVLDQNFSHIRGVRTLGVAGTTVVAGHCC
jgi:hypothetical protein